MNGWAVERICGCREPMDGGRRVKENKSRLEEEMGILAERKDG